LVKAPQITSSPKTPSATIQSKTALETNQITPKKITEYFASSPKQFTSSPKTLPSSTVTLSSSSTITSSSSSSSSMTFDAILKNIKKEITYKTTIGTSKSTESTTMEPKELQHIPLDNRHENIMISLLNTTIRPSPKKKPLDCIEARTVKEGNVRILNYLILIKYKYN